MSISGLLTGLWFLLVGATWLTWVSIDIKVLGLLAFVVGIVWLVEGSGRAPWSK